MSPKSLSQNSYSSDILQAVSNEDSTPKATETKANPTEPETLDSHLESDASSHSATETHHLDEFDDILGENLQKPKLKDLIQSSDSPSRYFTILSMVFALLALVCCGTLIKQYLNYRHNGQKELTAKEEEARLYGGWLAGQKAFKNKGPDGTEPLATQALGEFRVSWKGAELRVDLVAECTDEETCLSLKSQELQIRDLLLPLLQASSQTEILNPTQKLALRRRLAEKLNDLKLKGKIIQIDFNDMMIEAGPK